MWTIAVELSDKETWAQHTDPANPKAGVDFVSEDKARAWMNARYPTGIRCDVFHGLQRVQVVELKRK